MLQIREVSLDWPHTPFFIVPVKSCFMKTVWEKRWICIKLSGKSDTLTKVTKVTTIVAMRINWLLELSLGFTWAEYSKPLTSQCWKLTRPTCISEEDVVLPPVVGLFFYSCVLPIRKASPCESHCPWLESSVSDRVTKIHLRVPSVTVPTLVSL